MNDSTGSGSGMGGLSKPPVLRERIPSAKLRSPVLLMLTAIIWGTGFVAQRMGIRRLGPMTYGAARFGVASIALGIPVFLSRKRRYNIGAKSLTQTLPGGILCGLILFAACTSQQIGLVTAAAGKAGFLTALYIVATPLLGSLLGKPSSRAIWGAVALAFIGMALLCWQDGAGDTAWLSTGDMWLILCAIIYACHIQAVARFAADADNLLLSWIQTTVCAICTIVCMLIFEQPALSDVTASWRPIIYGGIFPIGIAYTLQVFGQRGAHPTVASLIMSLEAVFAAMFGRLVLGEIMSPRQTIGAAVVFVSSLLATLLGERHADITSSE